MFATRFVVAPFAILLVACSPGQAPEEPGEPPADLIFVGENIITMDASLDDVDAVAVRDEEIVAVGSTDEVLVLRGNETRVIDLRKV